MVISCILHRRVYVFVMVVFMCDACVFAVMRFSTDVDAYTDGGFFVATNITI